MTSSPSFVREPEGNGVAERFIRTLKENLLWVRNFATVAELVEALREFRRRYNEQWLIERHGYRTPSQARSDACRGMQTFGDRGRGAVEWVDRVGSPRSVSIHSRRAGRGLSWAIRNLGTERRSEPGSPSPRRRWRTSGRMAPPTRPGRPSPARSIRARPPGV